MDEYLDEGPPGNFETAALEISKDFDADTAQKNRENEGNEVVDRALKDCQNNLINEEERDIVGSWLLTEISLWDVEKERLVILTKKAFYSIKYDFISLKILEYNQVPLSQIDTLVTGELVYPSSSLAPRLSGLAEGVSSIIHCAVRQEWSSLTSCTGLAQFEPRKRHMSGMRLMWNKGNPLPLTKKWNPFAKDIPWLTYTSHPLFWYKGSEEEKAKFNVESLQSSINDLLPSECSVKSGLIIIENYFGVGALVHNRNGLGFFKIRGKVSF
ncbi:Tumor protein p63-regulated gene 1 protein [Anthophora quadrimaculata]